MVDVEYNKQRFIALLKTTNRAGVEKIISFLEKTDFFEAPASTKYHDNYKGGLCAHSLKVYEIFEILHQAFKLDININSIILTSLLHDICKINCYIKDKKNVKVGQNWVQEDYWKFDDKNPIGHGHKSVIILLKEGLSLNDFEINSIVTHMNGYDKSDLFNSSDVYKIDDKTSWLHVADFIATYE